MTDAYRPKGLSSAVCYQDAKAAYRWLEDAFGFEPLFVLLEADGNLGHSEMTYGNSVVMVGNEWSDEHRSPKSLGGKNTQIVHVQLAEGEDIDAHCVARDRLSCRCRCAPRGQLSVKLFDGDIVDGASRGMNSPYYEKEPALV